MENIDIKSEEVQEIIGTPPGWLVQWGAIMALATVVTIAYIGYFTHHPDTVSGEIKVAPAAGSTKLFAGSTSQIGELKVENESVVDSGQVMLVFQRAGNYQDVLRLESQLLEVPNLADSSLIHSSIPKDLLLDDNLQELVSDYRKEQENLRVMNSDQYQNLSAAQKNQEIETLDRQVAALLRQRSDYQEEEESLNNVLSKTKSDYEKGIISRNQLQKASQDVESVQREIRILEENVAQAENSKQIIRSMQRNLDRNREQEKQEASDNIKEQFLNLKEEVEAWKRRYLVIAPMKGIVIFDKEKLKPGQFVPAERELMTVVPGVKSDFLGRMTIPSDGSGKVELGQEVLVKLKSYPSQEFGALIGEVAWKAKVPSDGFIAVEVQFPKGLITNRNYIIQNPSQEMYGRAEIITKKKRLIEKVFKGG